MENKGITQLLIRLKKGEDNAWDKLYPRVYEELKALAYSHMSRQSPDHTLSRTELVHETYLKMIDQTQAEFADRSHFLGIASRCMRQILIDYARKEYAAKRGGKENDVTYVDETFEEKKTKAKQLNEWDDAQNRQD